MNKLVYLWHRTLNMPKNDLAWHLQDIADEMKELEEADSLIYKWSEISDVAYTYTRAKWSGYENIKFPLKKRYLYIGFLYMFPKYSLRWKFFRILGKKFDKNLKITEVRNPKKVEKLKNIARIYNLDPEDFKYEAEKLMKKWVFLK